MNPWGLEISFKGSKLFLEEKRRIKGLKLFLEKKKTNKRKRN